MIPTPPVHTLPDIHSGRNPTKLLFSKSATKIRAVNNFLSTTTTTSRSPSPAYPAQMRSNPNNNNTNSTFNTSNPIMIGPTAQLRELLRNYNPINALKECMVVMLAHPEVYGPLLSVVMREYDALMDDVALHAGTITSPHNNKSMKTSFSDSVTLFQDVAATNERVLKEKRCKHEIESLRQTVEELTKELDVVRKAHETKVREVMECKAHIAQLIDENKDLKNQADGMSSLLKQTREEAKRAALQHQQVYAVHNNAISSLEKRHADKLADVQGKIVAAERKTIELREQLKDVMEEKDASNKENLALENRIYVLNETVATRDATIQDHERTIADLEDDLQSLQKQFESVTSSLNRESVLQKREHEADVVPGMSAYMNHKESERTAKTNAEATPPRVFTGMGLADTVPIFLRTKDMKIENINLSLEDVMGLMNDALLHHHLDAPWKSFGEYFLDFLRQKHPNEPSVVTQTAYRVQYILNQYDWDINVDCMGRILLGTCPPVVHRDLSMLTDQFVKNILAKQVATVADVRRCILEYFPKHSAYAIACLFAALHRDVQRGNTDIAAILTQTTTSTSPTSYFMNELRAMFFQELLEFRQEVLNVLQGQDSVGKVTQALREVDGDMSRDAATRIATNLYELIGVGECPLEFNNSHNVFGGSSSGGGGNSPETVTPQQTVSEGLNHLVNTTTNNPSSSRHFAALSQISLIRSSPKEETVVAAAARRKTFKSTKSLAALGMVASAGVHAKSTTNSSKSGSKKGKKK
eukprot:PhF_6_TR40227/c0_g1_i1/m.59792